MSEIRTCNHCGATMQRPPRMPRSLWMKRKWCDRICMNAARAPKVKDCERCGASFQPAFTRQRGYRFCSIQCANTGKPISGPYRKAKDGAKSRTVHRIVMEQVIGRALLPSEIIHHEDGNKLNNSPSNLSITTNAAHSREHMSGNQHARRSRP